MLDKWKLRLGEEHLFWDHFETLFGPISDNNDKWKNFTAIPNYFEKLRDRNVKETVVQYVSSRFKHLVNVLSDLFYLFEFDSLAQMNSIRSLN